MSISEIVSITYNWFYTTDVGEQYQEAVIGKDGVISIQEGVLGGKSFYEVFYAHDKIVKILNPNTIVYKVEISKKRT